MCFPTKKLVLLGTGLGTAVPHVLRVIWVAGDSGPPRTIFGAQETAVRTKEKVANISEPRKCFKYQEILLDSSFIYVMYKQNVLLLFSK